MGGVGAFVLVGALIHHLIPEPHIAEHHHPMVGDVLINQPAGEKVVFKTVPISSNAQRTIVEVTLQPGGAVPLGHVHPDTDEFFVVLEGRLRLTVDGQERVLAAGDRFRVPRGIPHSASNPFDQPTRVSISLEPTGQMSLALTQVHGYLNQPQNASAILDFFQMLRFAERYGVYLEGLPIWIQRFGIFVLAPTARMMGFSSFYPVYAQDARNRNQQLQKAR